jgi:hypothetical protein
MPNRTNTVAAVLFGSFGGWLLTAFLISLYFYITTLIFMQIYYGQTVQEK